MVSDTQVYFYDTDSSSLNLHMNLATFGNTVMDWSNKLACPSGTWSYFDSYSLLSLNSKLIYSFIIFGNPLQLYFVTFSVSDGSVVGSRFKSSINWDRLRGAGQNEKYIMFTARCTSQFLLIQDKSSSTFTIKEFSGILHGVDVEPNTGR